MSDKAEITRRSVVQGVLAAGELLGIPALATKRAYAEAAHLPPFQDTPLGQKLMAAGQLGGLTLCTQMVFSTLIPGLSLHRRMKHE